MNITLSEKEGVTVLSVRTERLDAHNSDMLKDEIKGLFATGAKKVMVDLGEVRFIDSSGLGALVSGFKAALSNHGRMVLCGIHDQVNSMFELTRLNRVFDIYSEAVEGIFSFREQ